MNRFVFSVILLLSVLVLTQEVSADTRLTGTVGARTIEDNVVIPIDQKAVLNGTTIKGNVRVLRGATLIANGASIDGNVQAFRSVLVDLRQRTQVGGDVQGELTGTVRVRGRSFVGGNVQITQASTPVDVDALLVNAAHVGGDVQAVKSAGRLRALNPSSGGNLQFLENYSGPYRIRDNIIDGDLQFFKNRGSGLISGNIVGGNLQSKENRPRPTVKDNIVHGSTEIE